LFPLLYLFFLVPTGGFLVPVLQDFTASFVVHGLQIFGIPVFSDGVFITIPNGNFEVAEACAGLRFLIASIAFGFLFAYVVYRSWGRRLLFIALSLLVPVIANGFRALGIVLLAHYSNNTIAVGFDHIVYGWLFFSLVTLLLIWFGFLLREGPISRPPAVVTKTVPMAARLLPGQVIVAGILAILLVAAPRAYAEWREATVPPVDIAAFQAPDVAAPWQKVVGGVDRWQPRFIGPDAELRQDYVAGDKRVDLYIAFYTRQRYGAKAVSAENRLADDELWTRSGSGTARADVDGAPLTMATERMMSGKTKRVVWWWYWVNGRFTANGIVAKLLQAEAEIFGGDRSAAVVAVGTDSDSLGTERETLRNFLAALTQVKPMLDRVAEQ
jgi:EpsI family protein